LSSSERCAFCRIVRGELAAHTIFEDDAFLAFLDHRPLFPGHCLLVPKVHRETLLDLPPSECGPLLSHTQRLSRAVEVGLKADGFFVAMNNRVSQSVSHLHVHVVPRRKKDGLKGFFWPRHGYTSEAEMAATREAILGALAG
jgi:histidine triad (HIT) family protein